jgi:multidrug transporter EmrE-like cation transporter
VKQVLTVLFGIVVFSDPLDLLKVAGITTTFGGVFFYTYANVIKRREQENEKINTIRI